MLGKLGSTQPALLGKMMDLHAKRHQVIARNVANANTPHYRRRSFDFKESLEFALSEGTTEAYQGVRGRINRPNVTPVRNNGNNVDIDKEMMELKENTMQYEIYSHLYNKRAQLTKMAISGGR